MCEQTAAFFILNMAPTCSIPSVLNG